VVSFPQLLDPVYDLPPATVVTAFRRNGNKLIVSGTTSDNGVVKRVFVNGYEARPTRENFAEWEITLDAAAGGPTIISAHAEDAAGNVELRPHTMSIR